MLRLLFQTLFAGLCAMLFTSCATYNNSLSGYYNNLEDQNYAAALHSIEHNRLIKKNRNALLYNLEMGKLHRLQNDPEKSNFYLNRADLLAETEKKNFKDAALANVLNPMYQSYRCEDFEKFMIHYYKALNYAEMNLTEDAVVEARRITISSGAQSDKYKNKEGRYSKDAFALNLQGMIYEMAGNMNDAFISYRNAADVYLNAENNYYGVQMPAQLAKDVIRTASIMSFPLDTKYADAVMNTGYSDYSNAQSELILFLEEGKAPVKEDKNLTLTSSGAGNFYYTDNTGFNGDLNFNYIRYNFKEEDVTKFRSFKLSLPYYRTRYDHPGNVMVKVNGMDHKAELAQNINSVAIGILQERFLTDMASALARQITKRLLEKGTEAAAENISKSTDKGKEGTEEEKEKEKKKKEEKAEKAGEVAGFLMNMINTVTEKSDTRNWQSLPAFINYVRIPLHAGINTIEILTDGKVQTLNIKGSRGLQMKSIAIN